MQILVLFCELSTSKNRIKMRSAIAVLQMIKSDLVFEFGNTMALNLENIEKLTVKSPLVKHKSNQFLKSDFLPFLSINKTT
jgi:hypothetical protein